jgi:hypothetical protein
MTPDCGHAASAADGTWGSNTLGGQREFSAHKDVPVVLPVRDGSPGGSYGTATGGTSSVRRCSRLRFSLRDGERACSALANHASSAMCSISVPMSRFQVYGGGSWWPTLWSSTSRAREMALESAPPWLSGTNQVRFKRNRPCSRGPATGLMAGTAAPEPTCQAHRYGGWPMDGRSQRPTAAVSNTIVPSD